MSVNRNWGAGVFGVTFGGVNCGQFEVLFAVLKAGTPARSIQPHELESLSRAAPATGPATAHPMLVLKRGSGNTQVFQRWIATATPQDCLLTIRAGRRYRLTNARPVSWRVRQGEAAAGGTQVDLEEVSLTYRKIVHEG